MDLNSKRLLINDAIDSFSDDIAMIIADTIEADVTVNKIKKDNMEKLVTTGGTIYCTGRVKIKNNALLKFLFSRLSDDELIQLKLDHNNFIESIQKFDI